VWCSEVLGWGCRVSALTGRKVFIVRGVPAGGTKQKFVKSGAFNTMRFAVARQKAIEALEALGRGEVPKQTELMTLGQLSEAFLAQNPRGHNEMMYLRKIWLGQVAVKETRFENGEYVTGTRWENGPDKALRDRPAAYITRAEIVARLDDILARRGKWAANHCLESIRRVLNWAARGHRGGVTVNVASGLSSKDVGLSGREMMRTRVLKDSEFIAIWNAASRPESGPYEILVKVLMLTGQRRNDWMMARWDEIEDGVLTVPAERYKSRRDHAVPITPLVRSLLDELPRFEGCPWLFTLDGKKPIVGIQKMKERLQAKSKTSSWHHHDLRRSFRTRLRSEVGVSRDTCATIIGHAMPLDRVYDQGSHVAEKRAALERYERYVLELLEPPKGGNVVKLRARETILS
jgi:integrase